MDVDSERRGDEPQQPSEKETATGSGGLFGDLSHSNLGPLVEQDEDPSTLQPLPTQDFTPFTQHAASNEPVSYDPQAAAPVAGDATTGQQVFDQEHLANQSTTAGSQQFQEQPAQHENLPQDQSIFSTDTASQQPPPRESTTVSDQHPACASSSQQTYQSQPQNENAANPDHLPPLQEPQLAEEQDLVPDELDESDSAIGSDTQSTTTTLSQSVFDYRTEHGRTYHAYKDGKYIFPNDEREADRLDLQHHLFRITFANQLFFAPLDKPRRALDVGTGTGIWAIEFADEFPECQVVGIDLSPGQPTLVPPNLKFVIDDAEDMWIYPDKFDFIHARLMAGCFADWPNFFRQAYENLEPGGWLELQDYGLPVKSADGTADSSDLLRWGELLCEAARKLGRPMGSDCVDSYHSYMQDAGFVDIQQRMFMWPSNGWPKDPFMKELGRWNQMNILDGLEGFCLALLTRGLGWRKEEVDVFVARVSRDFRDRRIHAYFPMPVVFARKPLPGEVAFGS